MFLFNIQEGSRKKCIDGIENYSVKGGLITENHVCQIFPGL